MGMVGFHVAVWFLYHTEPRVVYFLYASPGMIQNVKNILIISEIDWCTTCMKYTIDVFTKSDPSISVYTDE